MQNQNQKAFGKYRVLYSQFNCIVVDTSVDIQSAFAHFLNPFANNYDDGQNYQKEYYNLLKLKDMIYQQD